MGWRDEVDWRYLRLAAACHLALWAYGAVLAGLHVAGRLEGALRTGLGLFAFAGLAVCLLVIFKLVRAGVKPPGEHRKAGHGAVSHQTFLIMIGFFVSVCGLVLLLSLIGLNGISFAFK